MPDTPNDDLVERLRELLASIQMPLIQREDSKGYYRLYQSPEEPHFVTGDLLAETFGDGDGVIMEAVNALPTLLARIEAQDAQLADKDREIAALREALNDGVASLAAVRASCAQWDERDSKHFFALCGETIQRMSATLKGQSDG